MRSRLLFFTAVWVVFIALAMKRISDNPVQGNERIPESATVYERLGGRDTLESWALEFNQLISVDSRMSINKDFKSRWASASSQKLKRGFVDYLCQQTQGPCRYSGPKLKKVFDSEFFGKTEWGYLKEAYLMSLRKVHPECSSELKLALERIFDEAQASVEAK